MFTFCTFYNCRLIGMHKSIRDHFLYGKFFILLSVLLMAEFSYGQDGSYIETLTGEKIACYGEVKLTSDEVTFDNAEGVRLSFKQKKLKSLHLKDRIFLNLPVSGSKYRLQEIVAYNDEYILTVYLSRKVDCFSVFNKEYKLVEGLIVSPRGRLGKFRLINEKIRPYFKDCNELIRRMNENLYKAIPGSLREDISNFNCTGSILVFI
jgi:hypothetical protein